MYKRLEQYLEELQKAQMLRQLPSLRVRGSEIELEGRRLLNLSSNDYLGIASRGDFRDEVLGDVAELGGAGSTSSRLMTGNFEEYECLESLMMNRFSREAALIFGSGYHMNLGILPVLASTKTVVLADRLIHASMIDGIRLSGCRFERWRHNDLEHLQRLLRKYASSPEIIVMVESIYSMDGDEADLSALVALKHRYPQIRLYVDEAHAIGVRGATGLGLAEETGTIGDIDFLLGTFSKALASMGGYLICDELVKRYLINRCRSLIFSTALPPLSVRFSRRVFEALPLYRAQRELVAAHTAKLHDALADLGLSTPSSSHIVPIIVGGADNAVRLTEQAKMLGYYTLPIRPPTVPEGSCRLRLSLTSETDITAFIRDLPTLLAAL